MATNFFLNVSPTPDGKKIVVCSGSIILEPPCEETDDGCNLKVNGRSKCDFVLYDPAKVESWIKLPGICDNWGSDTLSSAIWCNKHSCFLSIQACAFMGDYAFLVHTPLGIFTLDLQYLDRGWEKKLTFFDHCVPRCAFPYLLMEDGLSLTPYCGYDFRTFNRFRFRPPPPSYHKDKYYLDYTRAITFVGDGGKGKGKGEGNFCAVQTEMKEKDMRDMDPYLIIDFYRYNLAEYKEAE